MSLASPHARASFRTVGVSQLRSERALIGLLERAHLVCADLGGDPLANRYFELVDAFLMKFSLRYDLRRPFTLHPTLPGIFARMFTELKTVTRTDVHLNHLMVEFEDAIRDLRRDTSPTALRLCISKQINLLEGLGSLNPTITANTLGQVCDQLSVLAAPNGRMTKSVMRSKIFTSSYRTRREFATAAPASTRRGIDMRDMVAISVLLAGFTPYLSHQVDSNIVYAC